MLLRQVQDIRDQEFAFYTNEVAKVNDPKMLILLAHLYIEHLLERYLVVQLKAETDFFGKNAWSFRKKLSLAESFGNFNASIVAGIRLLDYMNDKCIQKTMFEPMDTELETLAQVLLTDSQGLALGYPVDHDNPWQAMFALFCGQVLGVVVLAENALLGKGFSFES